MGALTDLWKSERGLLCLVIIVAATVLTGLERMTVEQWTTFVELIFGTYVVGKTATGIVQIRSGSAEAAPAASTAPAVTPAPAPGA
jgi:hypothetical protein